MKQLNEHQVAALRATARERVTSTGRSIMMEEAQLAFENGWTEAIGSVPVDPGQEQADLVTLARLSAKSSSELYTLLKPGEVFNPHDWVLQALNRAYSLGELRGSRMPGSKKHLPLSARFSELLDDAEAQGVILSTVVSGAKFKGQFNHKAVLEEVPEKPAVKMCTLGDHVYPQPCMEKPAQKQVVYIVYPDTVYSRAWDDNNATFARQFLDGRVHLIEDHAQRHQKALRAALKDAAKNAR